MERFNVIRDYCVVNGLTQINNSWTLTAGADLGIPQLPGTDDYEQTVFMAVIGTSNNLPAGPQYGAGIVVTRSGVGTISATTVYSTLTNPIVVTELDSGGGFYIMRLTCDDFTGKRIAINRALLSETRAIGTIITTPNVDNIVSPPVILVGDGGSNQTLPNSFSVFLSIIVY